jgi:CheY-like chemotaxis protein
LRWLTTVTELKRMPDLFLLDFQLKGLDCSLHLDIVRRKWIDDRPKVVVVTGHTDHPALKRLATTVPVLRKPLSDPQFEIILQILSGHREFPGAGIF